MALQVEWVQYGRTAAQALRERISAAKQDDPLARVTVIVASNHVGVATRRLLASGETGAVHPDHPGLIAVDFLTPFRLAELYSSATMAAQGRLPVSTPVITSAMRASLADAPGVFAAVASHPATEEALVGAYRELRDVPEGGLSTLTGRGRKAGDVVRLCHDTRRRLVAAWYDEQDLTEAASEVLAGPVAGHLGTVIVYLPQRLTSNMANLIRSLALGTDVFVLAGSVGHEQADRHVAQAVGRLGLPGPPSPADLRPSVFGPGSTEIFTASDADEEVRQAVRHLVQAVRDGARSDRVAVLYSSREPYARLIHEHLRAADIPANGAAVIPLKERVAARTLLQAVGLGSSRFARPDLMAWLAGSLVLWDGSPAPVAAWERLARQAGVVHGRNHWDVRLAELVERYELQARSSDSEDDGEQERHAQRATRQAELARRLRDFALALIDRVEGAEAAPATWTAWVAWSRRLLTDLLGPSDNLGPRWPPDEVKAYERLERALDRLAGLDRIEGPIAFDVFLRSLELELDADLGRTGRLGEGVLVGPVGFGVGLDLDLLVVVGLAEGSYPTPVRDDSLLSDQERAAVADGDLPLRRELVARQHHLLLAAAASARHQILGMPRGDLRATTERMPSRWLLQAAEALSGDRVTSANLLVDRIPGVTHVALFSAGVANSEFASTEQERRLQELLIAPTEGDDTRFASGRRMILARRSRAFTRFDGDLSGVAVTSPVDQVVSATRLQTWVACPHAYFMQYVLGVRDLEDPSEESRISPLDRGSLIHLALERFIKEAGSTRRVWDQDDRDRMAQIATETCAAFEQRGMTGRPLYWSSDRRQILSDLDRFITEDIKRGAGRSHWPLSAEHQFRDALLPLPDGRHLRLQGMVDRIDVDGDGRALVIDYKTGKADPYRRLAVTDPGGGGAHLQLVIYALAARALVDTDDISAHYWMVSSLGGWGLYGYQVDDQIIDRVGRTVAVIVEGIERGLFPAHPTRSSTSPRPNCDYCDLDGLGEADLRRAWERKRDDPALALYRDLVEPTDG
jgi:RecB family exonuclease